MSKRTPLRLAVAVLLVLPLLVIAAPSPASAMPADSCATTGPKTLRGTVEGEDGRYLWAFIGVEWFDADGNKLPGASASGYHCHIRVNNNKLTGAGSSTSQGSTLTKNFSVAAPSGAASFWLELYVKTNNPLGQNDQQRYGFAKREKASLGPSGRTIALEAPLKCGITGDGGVRGRTGTIAGRVTQGGVPVPPPPGTWAAAWNQGPDSDNYIMGWNFGQWNQDGSIVFPNLAPDQIYSVWLFQPGKADVVRWSIPVKPCQTTRLDFGLAGSAPGAGSGVPPYQVISGDFDGDGHHDVLTYGRSSLTDHVKRGAARGAPLPHRAVSINGLYEIDAGDFDGDGRDDILFHGSSGTYMWWGRRDGGFDSTRLPVSGRYSPFTGDFDGDGRDDVLWYAPGGATDYLWLSRGARGGKSSRPLQINGTYEPVVGDFDGDQITDIIWYGSGGRPDYRWTSTAPGQFRSTRVVINGYYKPLPGDFDANGHDDVLWYWPGSRNDYLWRFDGDGYVSSPFTANGSYDATTGDLDGDGNDDIAWRNVDPARDDYLWFGTTQGGFTSQRTSL